jgi:beta-phosphoglucomutase family hydrolase
MSETHLEAVLWDMDGVIADTADFHYGAWQEVLEGRGVAFSKADFMRHFGQRHDTIVQFALGAKISPAEIEAISKIKQAIYRRNIAKYIKALPGVIKLIKSLNQNGIKTAIASSAVKENIDLILDGIGIQNDFQAIAYGTEVVEGKPSPEIFQLAAQKLGVQPGNCVVIEDAIAGVTAAKAAGIKCVAVTNSHSREDLSDADLIVDSLEKVNISVLSGLFK